MLLWGIHVQKTVTGPSAEVRAKYMTLYVFWLDLHNLAKVSLRAQAKNYIMSVSLKFTFCILSS